MSDYLAGLNEMVSDIGNEQTATTDFQGELQKGLDFSEIDYPVVEFVPAPHNKENKFDIIPFIVTQEWYERLLFPPPTQEQRALGQKYSKPRNRKVGQADIYLEIPFHRYADGNSGDAVCLREAFGENCPHCEEMFELYKIAKGSEGRKIDPSAKEKAKDFSPSWRTFINIYNYHYQKNPNAPEDHDGYEVINDMGRGALMKHIQICSRDTELGENFVYNYGDPSNSGYTIVADSLYKAPTSAKFNKGYTEFPNVKFHKRAEGVDYTIKDENGIDEVQRSISFDALATSLIYTYEEMQEMVEKKKAKLGISSQQEEDYDPSNQPSSSYVGTPEGNGINHDLPKQEIGEDSNGEEIDNSNSYDVSQSSSRRVGRRTRTQSADQEPSNEPDNQQEEAKPQATGRRRRR